MNRLLQKSIIVVGLTMLTLTATAIPARPGLWRIITLTDGTRVHAQLRGDSHLSFYEDADKNVYLRADGDVYERTTREIIAETLQAKQEQEAADAPRMAPQAGKRKAQGIPSDKSIFTGKKKGVVILVQFPKGTYNGNSYNAVSFDSENPNQFGCSSVAELYQKIINERNLNMPPFYGSVKDYFLDQSDGIFELDFDIFGPYTLANPYPYYGAPSGSSHDRNPSAMITEAVDLANNAGADFTKYDWDNDGTVEVVYVLYAGQGQADGGDDNTIWPHKSQLSSKTVDGKKISIYACSNEMATNERYDSQSGNYVVNGLQLTGIGTICHEFSHTIGFPDMYDTSYSYTTAHQGSWDLMDGGSYNGSWNGGHDDWANVYGGYRPSGFTAFERWCAGWLEPVVLTESQRITNLKPLGGTVQGGASDHGGAYVIYMPGATQSIKGKYYLLENRQRVNWDGALPWSGLLVNYIDYNETYWQNNTLNIPATAKYDHLTHFQAAGVDYLAFLELDAYPYNVDLLPRIFLETNTFYDDDGPTLAANFNTWFNTSYSSYKDKVKLNTKSTNEVSSNSDPQAYYYTTSGTIFTTAKKNTLSGQEVWDIVANPNADRTVDFNYRYPSEKTMAISQTTATPQSIGKGFYTHITTDRNILGDGTYNTLWLPFDLNYSEVKKYFGEQSAVFSFTGYDETEGLQFEETTSEGIKAYTPVLVQLGDGDSPIEKLGGAEGFAYVQVNSSSDVTPVVTTDDGWQFIGTKEYTTIPTGAYYLSDNKYYKAQGNAKLKAYRAYFKAPESANSKEVRLVTMARRNPAAQQQVVQAETDAIEEARYRLSPDNMASPFFRPVSPTTDIASVEKQTNLSVVYDLSGRRVSKATKGIYIRNGKKFVVR